MNVIFSKIKKENNSKSGQVMVLTILALGGALMGATAIAGLLMFYQIRQSTDLANSAKAIFAADTGGEWALYQFFCSNDPADPGRCSRYSYASSGPPFDNDASVRVVCYEGSNELPDCINPDYPSSTIVTSIRSVGSAGKSSRAFFFEF